MSARPLVTPGLLAGLLEQAPARVRRRLDGDPAMADGWAWSADGHSVAAGAETVQLHPVDGVLAEPSQVTCSCLLTPRCLHLLAVLSTLDPAPDDAVPDERADPVSAVVLTSEQQDAARLCWRAAAGLLASGANGADVIRRAEVLRAAHAARECGLHRAAAAATRVATGLRDLSTGRPWFTLAGYADDLAELLACAWRLSTRPAAEQADIGVGRRPYEPVGTLRLHGLCTEAVLAASGYAGVVTYLADESGRVWTVSDVQPGDADRIAEAYHGAVRLGPLALSHQALSRSALFGQGMTGSADGRLGSGQSVHAARTGAAADWSEPPLNRLWTDPPDGDLLFFDATVAGLDSTGLQLQTARGIIRGVPPVPELAYVQNLRRLGTLTGTEMRAIGRIDPVRPRTIALLAVGSCRDLSLPADWHGRVNLGLDEIPGIAAANVAAETETDEDPLAGLRRILHRVAAGGRVTAGPAAASTLRVEAARLRRAQLPAAAALIDRLVADASTVRRTATGESLPAPPDATARTWMAAMTYEEAARSTLVRSTWT